MKTLFTAALCALLLSACGQPDKDERATQQAPDRGRDETRTIRNTEAIGYAGEQIADQVDAALEATEQRKEELEQALERGEAGE